MTGRRGKASSSSPEELDGPTEMLKTEAGITITPPRENDPYWRISYYEERNGRRKRIQTSLGRDWSKANDEIGKIEERLLQGVGSKPTEPATDWLDWWLMEGRVPLTKSGTEKQPWGDNHRDEAARLMNNHLRPFIKNVSCEQLTHRQLQAAIDHARKNATPDTARRVKARIRTAVQEGFQAGWFTTAPDLLIGRLTAPAKPRQSAVGDGALRVKPSDVPGDEQIAAVSDAIGALTNAKDWYPLMVQLAATSGLRLGELLDLDVDDIDVERREVTVDTQVLETRGRPMRCALPKNNKTRITAFRATGPGGYDMVEHLTSRVDEALEEQPFTCCQEHGPRHLLFPAPRGGWWRQSNLRERLWTPARLEAGWATWARDEAGLIIANEDGNPVRHDEFIWSWHSLRHHAASKWIAAGAEATHVSNALGHSNITTTLDMYVGTMTRSTEALTRIV